MQDNLHAAHAAMLHFEGGWCDRPSDPGGATNKGVTLKVYQAWCLKHGLAEPDKAALHAIPSDHVDAIFQDGYWIPAGCDRLPPGLDLLVADFAYNSGPGRARQKLRQTLGMGDGTGPWTDEEVSHTWSVDDLDGLCSAYCDARLTFMGQCKNPQGGLMWAEYGKGWSRRVEAMRSTALSMVPDDLSAYRAAVQSQGHGLAMAASSVGQAKTEDHEEA